MSPDRPPGSVAELTGLDALDTARYQAPSLWGRAWPAVWPKLLATAIVIAGWQALAWTGWRDPWILPGPATVFGELVGLMGTSDFYRAVGITMQRALGGFVLAILIGMVVGMGVSQSWMLRRAIGSMITGLQSMPSIVWFPFAILVFGLTDAAILFVVVLGAAPAVANGLISGVDLVPPILRRAGRVLGATGMKAWRHVILPAALPSFVAGLKQGWAFAWRSLMAGELLVVIAQRPSIGARLQYARELSDAATLISLMIVVLIIGVVVDSLVFGQAERHILRNRGMLVGSKGSLGSNER